MLESLRTDKLYLKLFVVALACLVGAVAAQFSESPHFAAYAPLLFSVAVVSAVLLLVIKWLDLQKQ